MKSVMSASHNFATVPSANIKRSSFNRSSGFKTTLDAGYVVPVFTDEVLPGDTFNLRSTFFGRLATPIVPILDNLFLDSFYFFVPNRLLWTNWERFNGAQDNPADSTSYLVPVVTGPATTGFAVGSMADYFGIPTGIPDLNVNAFHFRAYNLIWNTWFRDQNLQNSVTVNTGNGPDAATDYVLKRRGKRHDYFTSCLPWPQKGTAVQLPISGNAFIKGLGKLNQVFSDSNVQVYESDGTRPTYAHAIAGPSNTPTDNVWFAQGTAATGGIPNIYADLSTATASTINQFRLAIQTQAFYEKDARGGTRYIELIKSHFGVINPDFRLQRPEYLGGGSQKISFNPISQTSGTSASGTTTPLGTLAAAATVTAQGHGFTKSFTEHGVILGFVSVRADLNYQQGLQKMWSRQTRLDFYWPAFAQLGEQSVLNKEIYAQGSGNPTQDAAVFGYQERYAEYRYKPSLITGQFRSTYSTPLDVWHLAQKYTALPTLGDTFISDTPPLSRVLAVGSGANGAQLLLDAFHDLKCARPMPTYSVPGALFRF